MEGDKKNTQKSIEEGKDPSKKKNEEFPSSSKKGKRAMTDDQNEEELSSSKKARKEKIKKPHWSTLEEMHLAEGVKKHGKEWGLILADKEYHFNVHRTLISLRHKWKRIEKKSLKSSAANEGGTSKKQKGQDGGNDVGTSKSTKMEDKIQKTSTADEGASTLSAMEDMQSSKKMAVVADPVQEEAQGAFNLVMYQSNNDPAVSKLLVEYENDYVEGIVSRLNNDDNSSSEESDSSTDDSDSD